MKKRAALLLAVLCLAAALMPGCKRTDGERPTEPRPSVEVVPPETDPNALRVLIDFTTPGSTSHADHDVLEDFKKAIAEAGGPEDITFEYVFFDDSCERDSENYALRGNELTRVRTEIMAGKGPDIFITTCQPEYVDPVFKYPDQVMSRRAFLPLDGYIENAQFMEWDKLTPAIMAAGKNEEGQQVLPLTYSLPLTVFRKTEVEHTHSQDLTLFDIAKSDNPVSLLFSERATEFHTFWMDDDRFSSAFMELADYDTETLAFSEEELKEVIKTLGDLENRRVSGEFDNAPSYYHSNLEVDFNFNPGDDMYMADKGGIGENERITLFPLYSAQGGYCATITSFAAINRNTKRPDDAFFVLDYLLSLECQCSELYANLTFSRAIPTHEEAMQKRTKVIQYHATEGNKPKAWYLPKSNFEELCSLRDNITSARFRTELDKKLVNILDRSKFLVGNEEALDREVHAAYMEMSMMLGES